MNVFRWNDWNRAKLENTARPSRKRSASSTTPAGRIRKIGGRGKWVVVGRGQGDQPIEVVYAVDPNDVLFIIQAMPLTTRRPRR